MISLAKLHGISHVLVEENGGMTKYLEKSPHLSDIYLKPETEAMMSTFMDPTYEALTGMLKVIFHNIISISSTQILLFSLFGSINCCLYTYRVQNVIYL